MIGRHVRTDMVRHIRVVAGTHILSNSANRLRIGVISVIIHPGYDTQLDRNDIALMELEKPIDLSMRTSWPINAVCLPRDGLISGQLVTTGWGHMRENGHNSLKLKAVELPLVPPRLVEKNITHIFLNLNYAVI